ncbi:MAG: RHS repeat protein, partial [Oscillospiraceae bacterium]|nr:RHS repeat protein [Oscillospiraceae bacterium]
MMKDETFGAEDIYLAPETVTSEDMPEETGGFVDEMTNGDIPVMVETEQKKIVPVGEALDLREENRKVFYMSDGSEQAVFYPETVHVFDGDTNTFEDVDNALMEEEDGKHYVNGKNRFRARFSREEENDVLFSVESGMHRVTVSAKKNGKQRNKGVKYKIHKKTKNAEGTDTLVFTGVQDGADYAYSVTGNGVKENILIKDKTDVYRYGFVIHQENVSGAFDEANKRIGFVSNETGEEVFCIPAPFMTDENGEVSTAVSYEVKNTANGDMILNVVADSQWMNAEDRAFPVVIDPQIQLSNNSAMTTYSWDNGSLYTAFLHTVGTTGCGDGTCNAKRMYMRFNMPSLPRNPRIKKAELKFYQASSSGACYNDPKLGLYRVTDMIVAGNCTPNHNTDLIDFAKMRVGHCEDGEVISYTFDVTTLVDQFNKGEAGLQNLVLKMIDENPVCDNSVMLFGCSSGGIYAPQFIITYESSYGVNTSYRTHTHELGRFGQGSIDLQCGNLMFESEDFSWAGNRIPVTIKHLYNSALGAYQYTGNSGIKLSTADFSAMYVGKGFKLNLMQSMMYTTFQHDGVLQGGYVYMGENGEEIYFKKSDQQKCCDSNSQCYHLYEDVNGGDMLYDPEKRTLKQGDDTYQFDSMGRLIKITDSDDNHMDIAYSSNRITCVTDGAGRDFWFGYSGNYLTSIEAPDDTKILYTYADELLSTITYPDGKKVSITYISNKPASVTLLDAEGNTVYKVAYTFSGSRLASVTEYGSDGTVGVRSTYAYSAASGRTVVETTESKDTEEGETADNAIKTVYTFDDEGNVVSEYVYSQDTGNTGVDGEESGIHPHSGDGGVGVVSNINNLLTGHNFESLTAWPAMPGNCGSFFIGSRTNDPNIKFGRKSLHMTSYEPECGESGVYQVTNILPAGQYTFSAYLRVGGAFSGTDAGAFIRVTDTAGKVLGISERLNQYDTEYTRLIVPFELTNSQSVQVQMMTAGKGTVFVNGAQLENNPYANAYNMLENGNFEDIRGWELSGGAFYTAGTRFNMSASMMVSGNLDTKRGVSQKVYVRKGSNTRETFILSGWAKGYGLPNHEREGVNTPTFRLRADIKYKNLWQVETHTADFSPCTEEWQLASVEFAKQKAVEIEYITVYCDYDYNTGTAYFDDIQLVRSSLETGLSASDFVVESTGVSDDNELAEETADTSPDFSEAKDGFGNALTETTFTDGEFGTIYRAFGYNLNCDNLENAGNDLLLEIDAWGNKTTYTVDAQTSRSKEVVDRCGNKTAYEYDNSGRTTKVTSAKPQYDDNGNKKTDADGNVIYEDIANVSYAYDAFDNMTEIVRGDGMKYVLAYNQFHNLESIGIQGKGEQLIRYDYKNGNGRLKAMTYANGHTMKATYNSIGQMIAEKWYNPSNELTAHYKYVYDGQGNIVQSLDITNEKCYNYEYEEGRLVRATEANVAFSGEVVTSKAVVNTVRYY